MNPNKINFKMEDTEPITCEKCNGEVFVEGMILRKINKLLAGTSEDGIVPIPTFACAICGHINEMFRPKKF